MTYCKSGPKGPILTLSFGSITNRRAYGRRPSSRPGTIPPAELRRIVGEMID
jgi:hypothetical protein